MNHEPNTKNKDKKFMLLLFTRLDFDSLNTSVQHFRLYYTGQRVIKNFRKVWGCEETFELQEESPEKEKI